MCAKFRREFSVGGMEKMVKCCSLVLDEGT